jgi:Protein of unknown function (DUF1353)
MDMPKLAPLPIKTKGKSFFARTRAWITEVRTWEVVEDWQYELSVGKTMIVPKGFVFDGASIPRPLWAILSPTGLLLIPGLIHDFAYRFDYVWVLNSQGQVYKEHEGAGQEYWDQVFYRVGREVNGMEVLNFLAWFSLALMGRIAWNSNRERNEDDVFPDKPVQPSPDTNNEQTDS